MQQVGELFIAKADHLWGTMNSHSARAGFRVPEYQRTYNWSHEKIKRLLEDCLNGFYYLSKSKQESYTFLGTIILVLERPEPSFDGTSLSVVDGQQRITTLVLLCCALIEELMLRRKDVQHLHGSTANWISEEIRYIREQLFSCVIGQLPGLSKMSPFPRIVRSTDNRARDYADREYRSIVGKFMANFADYYQQEEELFAPRRQKGNTEEERYFQNYEYVKTQVRSSLYEADDVEDNRLQIDVEHEQIQQNDFQKRGLRKLFEKLDTLPNEDEQNRAMSSIATTVGASGVIRMILFSYYLLKSVIITRVETQDEGAAFDIFDALNTTGEPLTALETFKPRAMRFEGENADGGYEGSNTEEHFNRIEENLNNIYSETEKRQKATKELLVTFALYLEGHKLPLDLASQRSYLRMKFEETLEPDLKRRFVQSLADIAEYQQTYWNPKSIPNLNTKHTDNATSDRLKLCCMFISDMNTSLANPILARYWVKYQRDHDARSLVEAVQAITGFLVLRRSVTGNTGRIDSDFRNIMKGGQNWSGLCVGLDHSNALLSVDKLKERLREYLMASAIGVENKETWLSRAYEVGLADYSRPLCRFLLFAASHNARLDPSEPGLLTREGVIRSDELDFLNFDKWLDDRYATVEHVAPNSDSSSGWDKRIYQRQATRHTIGNIILLPKKENSSVGNAPWTKKKIFYSALTAKTEEERDEQFKKAKKAGLDFRKETKNLLNKQERLSMLDPITDVDNWTESLIQRRTKNTLELAWDVISPWLNY